MSDDPKLKRILEANNATEMTPKLAEINIPFTPHSERRKTHNSDYEEYYSITRLLLALSVSQKLYFPLTLYKRQSPDFQLSMTNNKIGIEHTEAASENFKRIQRMWEEEDRIRKQKNLPLKAHLIPNCKPGKPLKTKEELQIVSTRPSVGWVGDSYKREWAEGIVYFVEKKIEIAKKLHFTRYPTNWLIIHDTLPLGPVEYAKVNSYLIPHLEKMNAFAIFDAIFVHGSSQMCEFNKSGVIIHSLVKPNNSELCPI